MSPALFCDFTQRGMTVTHQNWDILSVSSLRVKHSCCLLAGPACCPERSVWDYRSPRHKISKSADLIDIAAEARSDDCCASAQFCGQDGHNVNIRTVLKIRNVD